MALNGKDSEFETKTLPIIGKFNVQRFKQWCPEDAANWYIVKEENGKRPYAMYPCLGRSHINFEGLNVLIFGSEPRLIAKSIDFFYVVVGNSIFKVDKQYDKIEISGSSLQTLAGPIYSTFLIVNAIVFVIFVDNEKIYIYQENTNQFYTITDPNAPGNFTFNGVVTKPGYVAAFGNRIAVSVLNSSQFVLSDINLGLGSSGAIENLNPDTCFTVEGSQVFAQEDGIIRQMGVLNNTLYIFTDYITGVWSNIAAVFPGTNVTFPWKKSSTYNWNFGIANPSSLDIDFGYIVFLAQNSNGLLQFMVSNGGQPQRISDKSVDTLLQNYTNALGENNPFLVSNSNGFIYQYENVIFYRFSGGEYENSGLLNQQQEATSIEFNFENDSWHRCVELNGERNRIQQHVYFNNQHLVTVVGEDTIYNMSGQYYYNEIRNPNQPDNQEPDAYSKQPIRYERVTPIISEDNYAELETEYVEIDFVFGESNINYSIAPFQNSRFMIDEVNEPDGSVRYITSEELGGDGEPIFIIDNVGNTPSTLDNTYNYLLNPSIELYYSDDGGVSFNSADIREFSQMGVYVWKMRWYQLGTSRNRVYKLVCVSAVPIVILGGVMNIRRSSGGAN